MPVVTDVLCMLANADGEFVSGQRLADELSLSRVSIWKAVQVLQQEGYSIQAVRNRGYALESPIDPLVERGILDALGNDRPRVGRIVAKRTTSSTNVDARDFVIEDAPDFSVCIAGSQNAGKGRRGRSFFSPAGCGVYLSLFFRPKTTLVDSSMITGSAAVAVCRAIERVAGCETGIKWVNDIYRGNRKVCGILTEGIADLESGGLAYAVVGIGINVYEPAGGYPEEIAQKAGFICDEMKPNMRNALAAAVITECISVYTEYSRESIVEEYRDRSIMVGKRIVIDGESKQARNAVALGVNDDLSLRVMVDGAMEPEDILAGEVSIAIS